MNETEFPAITCNFLKAQDKLRVQGFEAFPSKRQIIY